MVQSRVAKALKFWLKAKLLGLNAIAECSIVDLGLSPSQFP